MKKLLIILLTVLMSISLFGCNGSGSGSQKDDASDVILVENADENYALFTTNGKQITEFHFRRPRTDEIYNGVFAAGDLNAESIYTTYLYNEKGELLISSEEFIEYKTPNIYILFKEEGEYAVDAKLKEIADVTDLDVDTYIDVENLITVYNEETNEVFVVSNNGQKSPSITASKAKVYKDDTICTVAGDTQTMVFVGENADYTETLEGTWTPAWQGGNENFPEYGLLISETTNDYRYYVNGKCTKEFSGSEWDRIALIAYTDNIRLIGYKNNVNGTQESYLDCDLSKPIEYTAVNNKVCKLDYNTVATISKDGTCTFVIDGNVKNTISDCKYVSNGLKGQYVIEKTDGFIYIYNEDGSAVSDKGYASVQTKQRNKQGVYVLKDTDDGIYYAVDSKMKQIADGFENAYTQSCGSSFVICLEYSDRTMFYDSSLKIMATIEAEKSSLIVYSNHIYNKKTGAYYNLKGELIYSRD